MLTTYDLTIHALAALQILGAMPPDVSAALRDIAVDIWRFLQARAVILVPAAVALVTTVTVTARWWRRRRHTRLARAASTVTIFPPPEADPSGGEVLWANLTGLLRPPWQRVLTGQPHVAFEYCWTPAGLHLRLWVPGVVPPGFLERAIEAAWPGAQTTTTPAEPPLPRALYVTGGRLRLARPEHYPLRHDHATDPLRALLAATADLHDGESGCVQILARPVTGRRLAAAHRAAAELRGNPPTHATALGLLQGLVRGLLQGLLRGLLDLLTPHRTTRPRTTTTTTTATAAATARQHPERAGEVRAILDKATHPRWVVEIRYAVATHNPTAKPEPQVVARLRGRAHQIASTFALYAGHNHFRRRRLRHVTTTLAQRDLGRGDLVSVPELAALAHLPLDTAVPGLARAGARPAAPPPQVPATGSDVKVLGYTDTGVSRPVAVHVADAREHLHVLGATGVGKSTLLAHLVLSDVTAGRGAVVIDPKGDLTTDLLARLPADVADRTVLFDPDDAGPPPILNVLDGPDPNLAVEHLVGIFAKIYTDFWGPRTDDVFRAACLTLTNPLHRGPRRDRVPRRAATLADVPRLLGEDAYRRRVVAGVRDPVLRGFWSWYDQLSDAHRSFITAPLLNKLRAFLLRPFVRATLAEGETTVDMPAVLDGGLCLVRLPKGALGEDTTRLLGSFLLARAWQTATHRARMGEPARRDAAVYIDECHNFLTLPHGLDDMLAEARAYRLSLTLAHQNLAQLGPGLRDAVSSNARNKIYFTVSPEDAHQLRRHVHPTLSEHDLAHLDAYQAAARLIVNNADTPAFTLRTRPLPPAVPGRASHIRNTARTRHTTATTQPRTDPAQPTDEE